MADTPEPPPERDVEAERRLRNQRRRFARRRRTRARWVETLTELEPPEVIEELMRLRHEAPMAFRKRLVRLAKKHGFYEPTNRFSPRDLPPLEERRAEDEDEGEDEGEE